MMGEHYFYINKTDGAKYFIEKSKESKDIKYEPTAQPPNLNTSIFRL